jgi:hypothetical protein
MLLIPNWLPGSNCNNSSTLVITSVRWLSETDTDNHIYIYVCVCVCVYNGGIQV